MSERAKIKLKGDALVMENERFTAEYLYADDLKSMVKSSNTTLDFVFIASCHSEFVTKIFLEGGANHVIGIKQD